ncbi:MAG: phage terminase small subunit [Methylococcales bacterium]
MWQNPLNAIKDKQFALAEKGEANPYLPVDDEPKLTEEPGSLEHYKAAMLADINQLKQLKTLEAKAAAKTTMLKQYMAFVNGYVNAGENYPNSVAVQVAIWLFDVGDIAAALGVILPLIKQAIHHSPHNFDRPLEVFCCDATYDWAAALYRDNKTASPYLDTVVAEMEKGRWSLPVAVESKMYAMLAKHKKLAGEYETALAHCAKAEAVNPVGAGVKKLKEDIETAMRKLAATSSSSPGQATA